MADAPNHTAHWVTSEEEVDALADLITDPQRTQLVVGVTAQPGRDRPMVDADELAARLGERAEVWVITKSEHAWALTEELPEKIDVYGGAVRAWNPIAEGRKPFPSDHPQWTVFGPEDADRVLEQVPAYAALADDPPPPFGAVTHGTVTGVRKAGAEIELTSGHPAFASLSHLVQHGEVFHAGDVLKVGQAVTVRVGSWHPQAGRVSVSLRDFAPDPWERLEEVYEVGDVIEVGVADIAPFGAFVELLPGVEGLLHKSKIADAFVEYVEDFVQIGERIVVRLLSIDVRDHKAEVTMLDIERDEQPLPPASIYPGGPPWLPVDGEGAADRDAEEAGDERQAAASVKVDVGVQPGGAPEPQLPADATALQLAAAALRVQLGEAGTLSDPQPEQLAAIRAAAEELVAAVSAAEADAAPTADATEDATTDD